ncbi:MAG: sigma-70 family RNA polymerase sigma factor, partial [Planctomycetota bacterium JB042]
MSTQHTLRALLEEVKGSEEVPYSLLDAILEREHALDRELPRILRALGQRAIVDDGFAARLIDADGDVGGGAASGPVDRYVARTRFLSKRDEVRLAKRIELSRRRLERAIAMSSASPEVKEQYFTLIETPEVNRVDRPLDRNAARPDERTLRDRWHEYLRLRNDLIVANIPLVERIAGRYRTYGIPHGDMTQHGNLGLIRAADKFDWRKGVRFRTYAEWWIRQAIERATDTDRDVIHVPRPMRQLMSKANHLHRRSGSQRPMTPHRFAELMDVDRGVAARAFSIKSGIASIDRSGLEDGSPMRNDLDGPDLAHRERRDTLDHLRVRLQSMMNELPEREQRVLSLRYGLDGSDPRTLEEVGKILHISRERVQIGRAH